MSEDQQEYKKYIIIYSDSYLGRISYYEAKSIFDVYRQYIKLSHLYRFCDLIDNDIHKDSLSVMKNVFDIDEYIYDDDDDDKDLELLKHNKYNKSFPWLEKKGREYIFETNESIMKLLIPYKHYEGEKKLEYDKEASKLMSDETVENLFRFFNTSGEGYQSGDPGKEWHNIVVKEYQEPEFIKL